MPENPVPSLPVYGFDPSSVSGLLSLAITVLLPVVVGLVTTRTTSAGVKGLLLLLAAAAVKSLLEAWLQAENTGVDFTFVPVAISVAVNFVLAAAVHFGLWKPAGVTDAAQRAFTSQR